MRSPYSITNSNGSHSVVIPSRYSDAEKELGKYWNEQIKLKDVVFNLQHKKGMSRDFIVKTWKMFQDQYGFGKKIPDRLIGENKVVPINECSNDWLRHHGLIPENLKH